MQSILIVEDEARLLSLLARIIEIDGYHVLKAQSAKAGIKLLENEDVRVVISDVQLPDENGIELIQRIKRIHSYIEVINLTAFGSIKDSVKAMQSGAFDYLTKGDDNDKILPLLGKALAKANQQFKTYQLENAAARPYSFETILGSSPAIISAIDLAIKVSHTNTTVLLLGETGTGKEVFAQAIHEESDRKSNPFIALNCSAFTSELLNSELFGYVAGAFTGANKDKKGLIEEANNSTLFLDEIGELSLELQAKLLRVLEDGTFHKIGDSKTTTSNVRIIAATNKDLRHEIELNKFRADLFYRLSVFTITLPPLRERRDDIEILANHFLKRFASKINRSVINMDPEFMKALTRHEWKGNIRELKNVIERVVILANGETLTTDLLPIEFFMHDNDGSDSTQPFNLSLIESQFIKKALYHAKGNKGEAARLLGISMSTLYRKIEEYKIV